MAPIQMTTIKCPYCTKGRAPLSERLETALACVPPRGWTTAKIVAVNLGIEHVNACHRLMDLLNLELLKRTQDALDGREWHYSRV